MTSVVQIAVCVVVRFGGWEVGGGLTLLLFDIKYVKMRRIMIRPNLTSVKKWQDEDSVFCEKYLLWRGMQHFVISCVKTHEVHRNKGSKYKLITNVLHNGERGCSYFGC